MAEAVGAETEWVSTELGPGRIKIENAKYRISVLADFSGDITDIFGNTITFSNLQTLIEATELLKEVFTQRYGGYK